ncbi:MAG: hypothetical protein QE263_00495 [Vampirovibrionales bacterium]|nr:hypothetical protein [Vampirovibrionales bacterium]
MPLKTITLSLCDEADALIGVAAYLALIAYPKESDIPKRDEFIDAVKAWWVKQARKKISYKRFPQRLRQYPNQKIDNQFSKLTRRFYTRRLPAWNIALILLLQANQEKVTLNKSIEKRYTKYSDKNQKILGNAENSYQRVWSDSKPILHLIYGLINSLDCFENQEVDLQMLLSNPEWLEKALLNAENIRKHFQVNYSGNKFIISDSQSIQVLYKKNP